MLTGLLFSRAFCRPSRVTTGTMGPMGGANWTVRACICSHWLCGPLVCYWPLCGHHGCSLGVPRGGFCHLPPHPPLPAPPTPPHLPTPPPHPPLPTPPTSPRPTDSSPPHPPLPTPPTPPPIPPTPSIINTNDRKGRQKIP